MWASCHHIWIAIYAFHILWAFISLEVGCQREPIYAHYYIYFPRWKNSGFYYFKSKSFLGCFLLRVTSLESLWYFEASCFLDFWFIWVLIFFSVCGYFWSLSFGGPCFCGFCMFPDLVVWVFIVLAELQDFMYWILCISCPLELYQNSVGLPTWAIWCSS